MSRKPTPLTEHDCAICGRAFQGRRHARTCSGACRVKLHRRESPTAAEVPEEASQSTGGRMQIFRLNGTSSRIYGIDEDCNVFFTYSWDTICSLKNPEWTPVPDGKIPVTLSRRMDDWRRRGETPSEGFRRERAEANKESEPFRQRTEAALRART